MRVISAGVFSAGSFQHTGDFMRIRNSGSLISMVAVLAVSAMLKQDAVHGYLNRSLSLEQRAA